MPENKVIARLIKDQNDELTRLRAENERLREALLPFAAAADTLPSFPDNTKLDLADITLGDLQRARAMLNPKERE